jgi:putative ABC transport system permease protein
MISDLRVAVRSLARSPGYALIVLATLALGIGVNVSMFTLLNTFLFKTVPFFEPDRLLNVVGTSPQTNRDNFSYQEAEDIRAQAAGPGKAFESVTTYSDWNDTISGNGVTAEPLLSVDASADFFRTYGVQPLLGRPYTKEEEVPGRNQVALLSYSLWQKRFAGDPKVIGRTLRLNSDEVTVIGVMPSDFKAQLYFGPADLWRPITIPAHIVNDKNNRFFSVVGRLNPGQTAAQARSELGALSARWAHDSPATEAGRGIDVVAPHRLQMNDTGSFIIWLMYGIGAAVLAVACANIASLQLARSTANLRELAIRSAIGASRARLVSHQMAEPLLLSAIGGVLGLVMASWMNRALSAAILINNEPLVLTIDARVVAAAIGASLGSGLLFGLLPAIHASRTDAIGVMKQGSRGTTSGSGQRLLRRAITVGEIAVAIALLSGSGAMIRGLDSLLKRDCGWDTRRVLTAHIHLPEQSRYLTEDSRRAAIEKLRRRLEEIPGADASSVSSTVPFFGSSRDTPFQVEGKTYGDESKEPIGGFTMVTPSFFRAFGIPIREGQNIPAALKPEDSPVVLVSETTARHFWPGESAVGKRIGERQGDSIVWRQVIGVTADVSFPLQVTDRSAKYQIYKPLVNEPWGYLFLSVRGENPDRFRRDVIHAVNEVDPDVAVEQVYTFDEASSAYNHNLFVVQDTLVGFALLALLLAALGLYGVISYLVAQRTNEIGIRMALGATRANVVALILRYGVILALCGSAAGIVMSVILNRILNSAVPAWVGYDMGALGAPPVILFFVALLACLVPALRATRIDPIEAMRSE